MIAILLTVFLAFGSGQAADQVSDAQKKEFINLLKKLPTDGEFYTEKAVKKAGPYLPVLFALTEKDIEKYDIYPFAAISRGFADQKEHREYAAHHFAEIRHPVLKLFWASLLFDEGPTSPEIVKFLRSALESNDQARLLSEMVGPQFEDFKRRVLAHPDAKQ